MGNRVATPVEPAGRRKMNNNARRQHNLRTGIKPRVLENPTGYNIKRHYNLGQELGRGGFGVTYVCTCLETGEKFACKSVVKKSLKKLTDIQDVRKEVEIMNHLPKHPNIVRLKATYEDNDFVYIVMEYCEGGELLNRIVNRGHYTERAAAAIMRTIVEVVQICHIHGVIHRDLKPENFLFANMRETATLKIIDFGLSVFFKPGEAFSEMVGTSSYMAPEVIDENYGPEVDIWSAGVILYFLLCGYLPFSAATEEGICEAVTHSAVNFKVDPWPTVSNMAKDLVKKMLDRDPKRRLTAQQALEHPWLLNTKAIPNVALSEVVKSRLRRYSVMNKLKKQALRVIAEHFLVDEVAGTREMFEMMDTRKKGKINLQQLKNGLQKFGHRINDEDLQVFMESVDLDGDGALNYSDFVAVMVHLRKLANDEHLRKAFRFFDKNRTGYIEVEELHNVLVHEEIISGIKEAIQAIMLDVDTDKDGRISYPEFAAMMNAGTDWRKACRQYSRVRFNRLSKRLNNKGVQRVKARPH